VLTACAAPSADPVPSSRAERATVPLSTIELGNVEPNQAIDFDVPAGTLGFHALIQSSVAGQSAGVRTLRSPRGLIIENHVVAGCEIHFEAKALYDLGAIQVPSVGPLAGGGPLPDGRWSLSVSAPASVRILVQHTPDGRFHGGLLDVHLYLPEGLAVDREAFTDVANPPPGIERRLSSFREYIQKLYGLTLGEVRTHRIDSRFRWVATSPERSYLEAAGSAFRETRVGEAGQSAHIFFVEKDASCWGYSGGLPGPATTTSNERSGVMLAISPSESASDDARIAAEDASTLAHELGHFVGLQHTAMLPLTDCLDDTPSCDDTAKEHRDACPDRQNVMFFAGPQSFDSVWASPTQKRVVSGSPIFRAFATDE